MEHSEMDRDQGTEIPEAAARTQESTPRYPAAERRRRGHPYKSPPLASILSIMPGLGQVYVGYYQRGFVHIIIVAGLITLIASGVGGFTPLLAVMLAFIWIYNIIDAGRRATLLNAAVDGIEGIEMPKDIKFGESGSILGGAGLIFIGFLLFLNTRFDVSMDWVEDWWPLAVIAGGVYLIIKAVQSRRQEIG